jgi:agmatine deiminase
VSAPTARAPGVPSGHRWPAEWEPHAAAWLAWPHNPTTWLGRLAAAQAAFAVFVRELSFRERVQLLVADAAMADAASAQMRAAGADCQRLSIGERSSVSLTSDK